MERVNMNMKMREEGYKSVNRNDAVVEVREEDEFGRRAMNERVNGRRGVNGAVERRFVAYRLSAIGVGYVESVEKVDNVQKEVVNVVRVFVVRRVKVDDVKVAW